MNNEICLFNNNNNNNNPIYKAPKALASEALVAGQSWVLLKSLVKEVRLKPRFKDTFKSIDLRHFCLVVINTFRLQSFQLTLSLCVNPSTQHCNEPLDSNTVTGALAVDG